MGITAASISLSGIAAAEQRLRNSAHNVANGLTKDFRSLRTVQSEVEGGGVRAETRVADRPGEVNLAREFVDQKLASLHGQASMRALETSLDMQGELVDLFA